MILTVSTPAQGAPSRVLVLKDWVKIIIQVQGAATITIGTSKEEAGGLGNGDGYQLNNTNAGPNVPPFYIWWKGELWASASISSAPFIIIVPGFVPDTQSGQGVLQCEQTQEFGLE
jgi:hypothetical protein